MINNNNIPLLFIQMATNQSRTQFDLYAGDISKYKASTYYYPKNIEGTPEAFNHGWMMINININDKSDAGTSQTVAFSANEKARRLPYGMQDTPLTGGLIGGAGVAAATAGAMGFKNFIKDGKAFQGNVGKTAVASLGAGALAAAPFLAAKVMGQRVTKRIADTIVLPMPNQLQTNYSMDWAQENTLMFDMMSRFPSLASNLMPLIQSGFGDKTALANMAQGGGDAASAFVLSTASLAGSGSVSAATGMAANPKKEMVFNSVNFRSFTIDYRLYPKSEAEMKTLYDIIYLLKYHMHPSFLNGETKFTYVYPSEFDITYFAKGTNENTYVNKVATCILENMIVNHTPDGAWVAHENGAPNGVSLQLTFKELSVLTKESIKIGY